MKQLSLGPLLSVCLCLCACTTPGASGQLSLQVQRPQVFGLKVIPASTVSLRINVAAPGSSRPELSQDLPLTPNLVTHTLILSPGSKQVEVSAFNAQGETVARASQTVEISVGRTTRAELELATVAVRPQPTDNTPSSQPTPNAGPQTSPTSAPGGSSSESPEPTSTNNPAQPSPEPSPEPSSIPSSQPTLAPVSGSGGGGSGSSGSSGSVTLTGLSADPTSLAGAGYVSELTASFSGNTPSSSLLSWSCLDANGLICTAPDPGTTANKAFWTAPASGASPFALKLTYQPGDGSQQVQTVSISVVYGSSGPLTTGPGTIDSGESGGGS